MSLYSIGRVCQKSRGRDAGGICVIVDVLDKNNVLVTGPKTLTGVRHRKTNIAHLDPLPEILAIQKGMEDKDIEAKVKEYLDRAAASASAASGNPP